MSLLNDYEQRRRRYLECVVQHQVLTMVNWGVAGEHPNYKTACDLLNYSTPTRGKVPPMTLDTPIPSLQELIGNRDNHAHDVARFVGMARLELARLEPKFRTKLFGDPTTDRHVIKEFWRVALGELNDVKALSGDVDFGLTTLLRYLYLYGELPAGLSSPWIPETPERPRRKDGVLPADSNFDMDIFASLKPVLLEVKYWYDEDFRAIEEPKLQKARSNNKKAELEYWSENHQISYASSEFLAGQLYPYELFRPGFRWRSKPAHAYHDFTGVERMARAKVRIVRWLDERLRFGWSEVNAPGYYDEHFAALLNLADFALDSEIQTKAAMAVDLLIYDLGRLSHHGSFTAAAARAHFKHKQSGWSTSVLDHLQMLFDANDGRYVSRGDMSPCCLATARRYVPPEALLALGCSKSNVDIDRSRTSFDFHEAVEHGIGFTGEVDVPRWWSRAAWLAKDVIKGTRELVERHGLQECSAFSFAIQPADGLAIVASAATLGAYVAAGTAWPLAIPLLGNPIKGSRDAADLLSLLTEGSAYTRADLYTYRCRGGILSSFQNYHPGQISFQGNSVQATLDKCATVFTGHPFEAKQLVGEAIGGVIGMAVGGLLASGGLRAITTLGGLAVGAELGKTISDKNREYDVSDDYVSWWNGSWTQPRVVQMKGAAIIAYQPHDMQLKLGESRTHAWFPRQAFVDDTENNPAIPSLTPVEATNCNIDCGRWIFGQAKTGGYIGLYSAQTPEWVSEGIWKGKELTASGSRNIFILQIGDDSEFGSFQNFKEQVRSTRIHVNGLHWSPANFQCSYDIPNGDRLELHYDDNQVRYAGVPLNDSHFPRFENRGASVAWLQQKYAIQSDECSLVHDITIPLRIAGPQLSHLEHTTELRVFSQNMGLFGHIPPYRGKTREESINKLIQILATEKFDVVGLSEMWQATDRARISERLRHVYPYVLDGPVSSVWEKVAATGLFATAGAYAGSVLLGPMGAVGGAIFGAIEGSQAPRTGGLMLLSRHPISVAHRTIFRQGAGEDSLSNKGAIHARIRPHGHPCEYDFFLSHTQNLTPEFPPFEYVKADAAQALADQLRHLSAFIQACRHPTSPALLMGDLNVDARSDLKIDGRNLTDIMVSEFAGGEDLKPRYVVPRNHPCYAKSGSWPPNFTATSEADSTKVSSFNTGNDDRKILDCDRFGNDAQRLDYFFAWKGERNTASFWDEQILVLQSREGIDLSDHYGLTCRLGKVRQQLADPRNPIHQVAIRPMRFYCLQTTSGLGSDEVEFTVRCVPERGKSKSLTTARYEDVEAGQCRFIVNDSLVLDNLGDFLMIVLSGTEIDWIGDDDLGTQYLRLDWRDLVSLRGVPRTIGLPMLTGDGGEYVVIVEITVT